MGKILERSTSIK